jgi:hypothetical protein
MGYLLTRGQAWPGYRKWKEQLLPFTTINAILLRLIKVISHKYEVVDSCNMTGNFLGL